MRPKEKTDIFMNALIALKAASAGQEEAKSKAWQLYPSDRASHNTNRVLFMRVFRAPRHDYERAVQRWQHEDANFTEIAAGVPRTSKSGAKVGNIHAAAQRTKFTALARCNSHWRSLSEADRATFLLENGLTYLPGHQIKPQTIQAAIVDNMFRLLNTVPFRSFSILTGTGKKYHVPKPNYAGFNPKRTLAVVWFEDDSKVVFPTSEILSFEEDPLLLDTAI